MSLFEDTLYIGLTFAIKLVKTFSRAGSTSGNILVRMTYFAFLAIQNNIYLFIYFVKSFLIIGYVLRCFMWML